MSRQSKGWETEQVKTGNEWGQEEVNSMFCMLPHKPRPGRAAPARQIRHEDGGVAHIKQLLAALKASILPAKKTLAMECPCRRTSRLGPGCCGLSRVAAAPAKTVCRTRPEGRVTGCTRRGARTWRSKFASMRGRERVHCTILEAGHLEDEDGFACEAEETYTPYKERFTNVHGGKGVDGGWGVGTPTRL